MLTYPPNASYIQPVDSDATENDRMRQQTLADEDLKRLRRPWRHLRKDLCMFPDFLGIGAQKSGTTRLYQNLAAHPQIWMPPVKELHYLDHKPKPLPVSSCAERISTARRASTCARI